MSQGPVDVSNSEEVWISMGSEEEQHVSALNYMSERKGDDTAFRLVEGIWMSRPGNVGPCPRGLEFLTTLDHLFVHQEWTGIWSKTEFVVKNRMGEKVYRAGENASTCAICCVGDDRQIDIMAIDSCNRECIQMYRPLTMNWCDCHVQTMEVFSPPGCLIGSISQELSFLHPRYNLKNSAGDIVLYVEGPVVTTGFFGNVDFKVLGSNAQTVVGRISKQWTGLPTQWFTNIEVFGVSFPIDLDVRMKAVVLAACFLIDYTYYGSRKDNIRI